MPLIPIQPEHTEDATIRLYDELHTEAEGVSCEALNPPELHKTSQAQTVADLSLSRTTDPTTHQNADSFCAPETAIQLQILTETECLLEHRLLETVGITLSSLSIVAHESTTPVDEQSHDFDKVDSNVVVDNASVPHLSDRSPTASDLSVSHSDFDYLEHSGQTRYDFRGRTGLRDTLSLPPGRDPRYPHPLLASIQGGNPEKVSSLPENLKSEYQHPLAGLTSIQALSILALPPSDAKPGSVHAPWLHLTDREMALMLCRKRSKRSWIPTKDFINRELHNLGRGQENFLRAIKEAEKNEEASVDCDSTHLVPSTEALIQPSESNPPLEGGAKTATGHFIRRSVSVNYSVSPDVDLPKRAQSLPCMRAIRDIAGQGRSIQKNDMTGQSLPNMTTGDLVDKSEPTQKNDIRAYVLPRAFSTDSHDNGQPPEEYGMIEDRSLILVIRSKHLCKLDCVNFSNASSKEHIRTSTMCRQMQRSDDCIVLSQAAPFNCVNHENDLLGKTRFEILPPAPSSPPKPNALQQSDSLKSLSSLEQCSDQTLKAVSDQELSTPRRETSAKRKRGAQHVGRERQVRRVEDESLNKRTLRPRTIKLVERPSLELSSGQNPIDMGEESPSERSFHGRAIRRAKIPKQPSSAVVTGQNGMCVESESPSERAKRGWATRRMRAPKEVVTSLEANSIEGTNHTTPPIWNFLPDQPSNQLSSIPNSEGLDIQTSTPQDPFSPNSPETCLPGESHQARSPHIDNRTLFPSPMEPAIPSPCPGNPYSSPMNAPRGLLTPPSSAHNVSRQLSLISPRSSEDGRCLKLFDPRLKSLTSQQPYISEPNVPSLSFTTPPLIARITPVQIPEERTYTRKPIKDANYICGFTISLFS